jgi:dienelactone hydrolase
MFRRLFALATVLIGMAAPASALEGVQFPSRDGTLLSGLLAKPVGAGPFPAVVALHGCAGLWGASGKLSARETDWARRLVEAGFVVLLPDSFRPLGIAALCNDRQRSLLPAERAEDAFGASAWLAEQPFVAGGPVALTGWSNGGMTALEAAGRKTAAGPGGFSRVIAFYPGCRALLRRGWSAQVPTTILHGLADDWTPAAPCERLAKRGGARFVGYPDAFNNFDHPNLPLRERSAAYSERGNGKVTIGTNAHARAQAIAATMEILQGM